MTEHVHQYSEYLSGLRGRWAMEDGVGPVGVPLLLRGTDCMYMYTSMSLYVYVYICV